MRFMDSLRDAAVTKKINRYLTTVPYILLVCLLTLIANMFAAELVVYTLLVAIGVYICLLGDDLLGLMPLVVCAYLAPAAGNNPGRNGQSVFTPGSGGIYILCLAAVLGIALAVRVITDRKVFLSTKRRLLPGILLLGMAYVFSGIGSPAYPALAWKNILFALLQLAAIVLPYWLFSGGVRWEKTRSDYLAWTGFGVGGLLVCEILWCYCTGSVVVDGVIDRSRIYTGWGMYNNMGGMLAMMIPFAFYLAARYQRGWIGSVVGSVFLVGVVMTCSRSSILVGCVIFLVCIIMMLFSARNRRGNTWALITSLAVMALLVLIFHKQILRLFTDLISVGMDPSSRDTIYTEGLKQFLRYPIFGGSFYPIDFVPWDWATEDAFSSFFPPRWHNTIVQLLASCGVVGLGAYLFHRYQTTRMLVKDWNREKAFIGCAILVLRLTSLFDCHFFNIGPVLFYAMALAFAENCIGTRNQKLCKPLASFHL